tara:strand:- start:7185 stop:7415 length:231 start_codon:yes stop_codon:yes gene_type:complete
MKQKEILKTINDLLSLTKDNQEYNDAWNKGYELFKLISKKQLILTDVGCSYFTKNIESRECKTCKGNGITWHKKRE